MKSTYRRLGVFEKVWLFAPLAVWFSYRPLLQLGSDDSTYFELSPTLVYVALLAFVGLPIVWREKRKLAKKNAVRSVTVFLAISGVSLLWTPNIIRGLLTFGLIGALYSIFLASLANAKKLASLIPVLGKLFILCAVLMSVLALIQVVAGTWLGRDVTLLCRGCGATQFGFARPNVFTIEPQFLGNILMLPALMLFYRAFRKKSDWRILATLFIVMTGLLLTLSRGAIFAFVVGLFVLCILYLRDVKIALRSLLIVVVSLAMCLGIQGSAAALNPRLNVSFTDAVAASVNQLSLGLVDINSEEAKPTEKAKVPLVGSANAPLDTLPEEQDPHFRGYVEESTNVRLKLSTLSLGLWASDLRHILVGVGLGGSGQALREYTPEQVNEREIVQNEYVEMLLETGIFGAVSFMALIASLLLSLSDKKWPLALVVACLVQWNFFSGYPNALHIYLLFILFATVGTTTMRKSASGK